MNLKNTWVKILASLLSLVLLFSCAATKNAVRAESPDLLETFMKCDTIPQLFDTAEKALQEGTDPTQVKNAMYSAADSKDMYPYFTYAVENYISMGGKGYNKLMNLLSPEESTDRSLNCDKSSSRSRISRIGFDAYSTSKASPKFKSMINDSGAGNCISSYFLAEEDFKTLYKKSFSKFVPNRPRAGYVCVVLTNNTQSSPNTLWTKESSSSFRSTIRGIVEEFFSKASNAGSPPVITGNPHIASDFLTIELTYPFHSTYHANVGTATIRGYNCKLTIRLKDAKSHETLATYSQTTQLGSTVTVSTWATYAKASVPDYKNNSSFTSLAKTAAKAFKTQDREASASRPLTESNAKAVLDGILQAQAKGASTWEAAIYESGAENITFKGSNEVTFALRNFNPNLKKLGAYADAKDPDAWLDSALQRISKHNLTVTLTLSNGVPTKKSLNELKAAVQKAANSAKKAWASADITAALKDHCFPSPVKGKVSSFKDLLKQTDRFRVLYKKYLTGNEAISRNLFAVICYAQKSLSVNTKEGPHKLSLTFTGVAKPDKFIKTAANQVVNSMRYKPLKSRNRDEDPLDTLFKRVAKNAISSHTNAKDTFTLKVDVDRLKSTKLPSSYASYLNKFDLREVASSMSYEIGNLPDIAAIEMPGTKLLSGGKSGGAQMILKASSSSSPTYIQIRKKGTKEKVATLFIHPGNKLTIKAPGGDYYLVYCSGTYWYGEKNRFMEPNNIFYSETILLKNGYSRELELNVSNGNVSTYRGSSNDLDD